MCSSSLDVEKEMPRKSWPRNIIRNTNTFSVRIGPQISSYVSVLNLSHSSLPFFTWPVLFVKTESVAGLVGKNFGGKFFPN